MKLESLPPFQGPENAEVKFNKSVEDGKTKALNLIIERFEKTGEEKDRLDFHNSFHTWHVYKRVVKILEAVRKANPEAVSMRETGLAKLAAVFHDAVQKWEPAKTSGKDGLEKVTRKRFTGENEKKSAEEATSFMDGENQKGGSEIFSDSDKKMVAEAIDTTIPVFEFSKKTVIQPTLEEKSSIVARALALADIGAAGMEEPESFLREGDNLFREENLDIKDTLKNIEGLTAGQKFSFRKRMLDWTESQASFAGGRKELLEKELAGLPDTAKEAVKKLFSHFDDSIKATKERMEKRGKMDFEELVADMGYNG